jgi:hypothetical protein
MTDTLGDALPREMARVRDKVMRSRNTNCDRL